MIYEKNDVISRAFGKKKIHHFLNWLENVS